MVSLDWDAGYNAIPSIDSMDCFDNHVSVRKRTSAVHDQHNRPAVQNCLESIIDRILAFLPPGMICLTLLITYSSINSAAVMMSSSLTTGMISSISLMDCSNSRDHMMIGLPARTKKGLFLSAPNRLPCRPRAQGQQPNCQLCSSSLISRRIILPAVVCSTLVTSGRPFLPISFRAFSTTTMVPSSRYAHALVGSFPSLAM